MHARGVAFASFVLILSARPAAAQDSKPVEDSLEGCVAWLKAMGVSGAGSVEEAKKLTYVDLGSAKKADDDGLKLLRHLPALERVSLYANGNFTVKGLEHMKDCPKLRWLSLGFTKCGAGSGKPLAACKGLKFLSFYVTDVTDEDVAELAGLPLEELSLESAKKITDKAMPHVGKMAHLRSLNVSSTQVTDAGLESLKGLGGLETLSMFGCKVDAGLSHLAGMKIKSIWVTGKQLTDGGVKHLASLKSLKWVSLGRTSVTGASGPVFAGLPALETLLLTESPFGDDGLQALAACKTLVTLNITETTVTDKGLEHLAKLEKLQTLYVDTTSTGDAGVPALARIPNLRSLYLSRTKVTDAGMAELAKAPKLETVVLNNTAVTDAAMESLGKVATLRYVYTNGTKVTAAGKKRIKELVPKCSAY